jgi:hypothetical protein
MTSFGMMYALTHVLFVLELSLFCFILKHKDRYYDTMVGWFYWLYDIPSILTNID